MSFTRAAFSARTVLAHARRYSTTPPPTKSNNLPLILGGAGVAGLVGYLYLQSKPTSSSSPSAAAKPASTKSPLDPDNFVDFKLKEVKPYNHNTATFVFELPDGMASQMPVASCLYMRAAGDGSALLDKNGKPIAHPYTPISPPDAPGELALMIKRYDVGRLSEFIHKLKVGESLAFKGPIVKFIYKTNEFEEVGMIAGGSGITPMYQILQHALKEPENKTKFTLLFANVTEQDILLREDFDQLKKQYPDKLNVIYTLDQADAKWKGYKGYVNKEMIMQHIAPANLDNKVKVFICGPPGQVASIAGSKDGMKQGPLGGVLKELGYTEEQVFKF